jgi:N-methylhydantoinase B
MNNLTIGGMDPRPGALCVLRNHRGRNGSAADERRCSGVHTHMTNSLNTPAEALSMRTRCECAITGCGGEVEAQADIAEEMGWCVKSKFSLTHWQTGARGALGLQGEEGAPVKLRSCGDGTPRDLPGKCNVRLRKGERIRVESPGAGGWGKRDM